MLPAKNAQKVAYYITPHGFGHAVRSLEVIRTLLERRPDLEVVVVSDIPEFLIEQNVGRRLPYRRRRLDVGLVQRDSLRFDLEASLGALEALHRDREALIEAEAAFLREEGVGAVVADIPFLAFFASAAAGVSSIGISNFTWDWIYAAYAAEDARWWPLIDWVRQGYRHCGLFLQLPMHGDCSACPRREDVPLVARHPTRNREATRRLLGCPPELRAYLMAFSELDLPPESLRRLEEIPRVLFYHKRPLRFEFANGRSLNALDLSYPDTIAAMDGVVTKPGYGIVSDCLCSGTPMVYTDRGNFPEYPILVDAMVQHLATVYLPSEALYAGRWAPALEALAQSRRRPAPVCGDGARVCAEHILGVLERRP